MSNTKQKAFTLVELIVVIVILSILATIAFLSFSSQSSSARDSQRLSDISSIAKGLSVQFARSGKYPIPDSKIIISSGTGSLGYQGNAGNNILRLINLSSGGIDPSDKTFYTYNSNSTQNKYQLLAFLENKTSYSYSPFSDIASATDYTNRYPYERGDNLGIILSQSGTVYTPIQDTGTGIDVTANSTGMVTFVDNSLSVPFVSSSLSKTYSSSTYTGVIFVTKGSDITSNTDIYSLGDTEIKYIFDTGSYYTQNWSSNPCTGPINVITVTDFSSAYAVPANTIAKIPNGTYSLSGPATTSGHITFAGNCSALIGQSKDGVIFNSNFTSGGRVFASLISGTKSNTVLANLSLNGNKTAPNRYTNLVGFGNGTTINNNTIVNAKIFNGDTTGVSIGTCDNCMLSDAQTFEIDSNGIDVWNSQNIILNDLISYNNTYGIILENSTANGILNNFMIYNNSNMGLYLTNTRYDSISNGQIFNNDRGMTFNSNAGGNYLKNIAVYGNNYGVWAVYGANYMNNLSIYNNNVGYFNSGNNGNKYYGSLTMFGATQLSFSGTTGSDAALTGGTDSMLGWPNGNLNVSTAAMDCSYHLQPNLVGSWGSTCGDIGYKSTGLTTPVTSYSFGSNMMNQTQFYRCPTGKVCFGGSNIINFGVAGVDFDTSKKIGQW